MRPALVLAAALVLPPAAAASSGGKVKVAVMEIRPLGTDAHKAELLSEVALTEASGIAGLDVIGRSDIASMVGFEKQKKILGCVEDSACLAEIGGALGVDALLIGSLGRLGNLYRIDLKVVDTRRARVLGRVGESVEGSEEKLVATVTRGVRQLLTPLLRELPAPMAGGKPLASAPAPSPPPPEPPTAAHPATVAPAAASGATVFTRATWGWSLAGAGGALVAGGVVMGLQAQKAYQDEKRAFRNNDPAAYDSARSKAKSRGRLADVLYGLGAASAGVGLYLVFTGRPAAVAAVPAEGGAAVMVAGRF